MTSQSGKVTSIAYNEMNLPVHTTLSGGAEILAGYNGGGYRILKELKGQSWEYHLRDATRTLAVVRNDTLQYFTLYGGDMIGQIETPDGTLNLGSGHRYFLKDHLGSIRQVVDATGASQSTTDYYPFGLTMPGRSSNSANPNDTYKFTGHERDDEAEINLDYMLARNYDPVLGRFLQIDPYGAKFPDLSPYSYAFNNPLRFIDPDGRAPVLPPDIIVLNDDSGAGGFGHNAVLVGNNKDGWTYYSKDGPDKYTQTTFATLDDALSSDDVERYDTGVRFETTAEQDEAAKAELDVSVTGEYSFTKSNCADLCNIGLKAGEVSIDEKATKTVGVTHQDKQSRVLEKKEGVTKINIRDERKRIEKEKQKEKDQS